MLSTAPLEDLLGYEDNFTLVLLLWVHSTVRLTFTPLGRPIGFMDYEMLQEYLQGLVGFSERRDGYWECDMFFLFRRGADRFAKAGNAFLTIEE